MPFFKQTEHNTLTTITSKESNDALTSSATVM